MEPENQAAEAHPIPCNDCGGSGLGPDRIDGPGEVFQDPCGACEGTGQQGGRQGPGAAEDIDPRLNPDEDPFPAAPSEPAAEAPPAPELRKYRVIGREAIRLGIPLDVHERATLGDKIGSLATSMRQLERDHEEANVAARAEAKLRREAIQDAQAALDAALEAQTTGVETRTFPGERRGVIATTKVELVRLDTEEVVESRDMTEAEQAKWCRQGDILDVAGGATVPVSPTGEGEPTAPRAPAEPAAPETDDRWAAGDVYPEGWPVAWKGKEWLVQIGDDPKALREADVLEVWLRLNEPETGEGQTVKDLALVVTWVPRQGITRALQLLRDKVLAKKTGQKWWALKASAAPAEVPEPGRADTLPEAGDITRPRLSEPETVADAMLADAGEVAGNWGT